VVREGLQSGTRIDLLSVFLHKKYIYSYNFYLLGSVNKFQSFCVAYFPCWFLKMGIILSHSHFLHVVFVSIMVFQTFDRIIFITLTFAGTRWYGLTARDPQMVRDQKKFGNHCFRTCKLCNVYCIKIKLYQSVALGDKLPSVTPKLKSNQLFGNIYRTDPIFLTKT